jgi:hypothetical protein
MSLHQRMGSPDGGQSGGNGGGRDRQRRALGIQQVLEWAFRVEKVQLELPERVDPEDGEGFGFGLEYVLLQRAALGCRVDGGPAQARQLQPSRCRGGRGPARRPAREPRRQAHGGPGGGTGARRPHPRLDARRRAALRSGRGQAQPAWRTGQPPLSSAPIESSRGAGGAPSSPRLPGHLLGRIPSRSQPHGAAMTTGGRRWTGSGDGLAGSDAAGGRGDRGDAKGAAVGRLVRCPHAPMGLGLLIREALVSIRIDPLGDGNQLKRARRVARY